MASSNDDDRDGDAKSRIFTHFSRFRFVGWVALRILKTYKLASLRFKAEVTNNNKQFLLSISLSVTVQGEGAKANEILELEYRLKS